MALLRRGQVLEGRLNTYTLAGVVGQNYPRVGTWQAKNRVGRKFILKDVRNALQENERDVLRRFQSRGSTIRPLVDEIEMALGAKVLVLQHLDYDLCEVGCSSHSEYKFVTKSVLQALAVLHEDGYVHNDIRPANILCDLKPGVKRWQQPPPGSEPEVGFSQVKLGDLETCFSAINPPPYTRQGQHLRQIRGARGAMLMRSPEKLLHLPWGPPSDIWSLGATLLELFLGDEGSFEPGPPWDHPQRPRRVLEMIQTWFGPFPDSYRDLAGERRFEYLKSIGYGVSLIQDYILSANSKFTAKDMAFIARMMKHDPRDRPTAKELLKDPWLETESSFLSLEL